MNFYCSKLHMREYLHKTVSVLIHHVQWIYTIYIHNFIKHINFNDNWGVWGAIGKLENLSTSRSLRRSRKKSYVKRINTFVLRFLLRPTQRRWGRWIFLVIVSLRRLFIILNLLSLLIAFFSPIIQIIQINSWEIKSKRIPM